MALTVILPSGLSNTGNFAVGSLSATGNLSGGNISAVGNINVGGNLLVADRVGVGITVNSVYDAVAAQRPLVVQQSDTSTTLNGSTAAIAIVNGDTTTNNTAQLNFAAITGASTNQYSSAVISCIFGARTNAQYPTGILTFSTSTTLNAAPSEKMRIDSAGNLSVIGSVIVNSAANPTAIVNGASNAVGNIGSASTYFNRLFAQATTALYADLAEMYTTDAEYEPGTVLIFGGNQEVTVSTVTHDTRVAGVVSTNPAHIMNSGLQGEFTVAVALTGRVPVSVIGNITAGDRVVTSNRAGVAEALDMARYQPGVIIGKALQSYSGNGVGVIEVVVGRL